MKLARAQRRQIGRWLRDGLTTRVDAAPETLRKPLKTVVDYLDLLFVDHGIFRLVYSNRHRLSLTAWRMAQPTPGQLRSLWRSGIRTVVNLRGERDCGAFRLETKACEETGLKLVNVTLRSRGAPERETVFKVKELLDQIEYPILAHCKSGADRAGLFSVLYLHLREGVPIEVAKEQLHWRYGHFRQADTGILDAFFDSYIAHNLRAPMPFLQWVESVYDPDELKRNFRASSWGNILVNGILRRE